MFGKTTSGCYQSAAMPNYFQFCYCSNSADQRTNENLVCSWRGRKGRKKY